MPDRGNHWDGIYATTPSTEVSWYEREPATSLRLVEETASGPSAAIIDLGAGASLLVDRLLARGFTDVTVLDISEHVLAEVQDRLGERASYVKTAVVGQPWAWQRSSR